MKQLIFIALGICVLTQYACKKVQPEMKGKDCSCAKETSADFDIEEIGGYGYAWEKRSITDSTFKDINIGFTAKDSNATYTWYIGNEVLNSRSVVRYFNSSLVGQTIPITLVVKKNPNKICFPFDDGYDSITKTVVITNRDYYSSFLEPNPTLEGVFRMKEQHSIDSIDISFNLYQDGFGNNRVTITNYDGFGAVLPGSQTSMGTCLFRQMWWDQNYHNLMLYHKPNGEVDFIMTPKASYIQGYNYKGRKIQ